MAVAKVHGDDCSVVPAVVAVMVVLVSAMVEFSTIVVASAWRGAAALTTLRM